MGFQMMGTILIFTFGGYWADRLTGSHFPVFTVVLCILGVLGAMYVMIRKL